MNDTIDFYVKCDHPSCLEPGDWIQLELYDDNSNGEYLVEAIYYSTDEIRVIKPNNGFKIELYTANLKLKYLGKGKKRKYGDFSIFSYYVTPYTKPKNTTILWNSQRYS